MLNSKKITFHPAFKRVLFNHTIQNIINFQKMVITANQLKIKGVSFLDSMMQTASQVMISVRGKPKYMVLPLEKYEKLYESELDTALHQSKEDIKNKKFHTSTSQFFDEIGI